MLNVYVCFLQFFLHLFLSAFYPSLYIECDFSVINKFFTRLIKKHIKISLSSAVVYCLFLSFVRFFYWVRFWQEESFLSLNSSCYRSISIWVKACERYLVIWRNRFLDLQLSHLPIYFSLEWRTLLHAIWQNPASWLLQPSCSEV